MPYSIWRKTEHGLVPADEHSEAAFARLKVGQYMRADETARVRSPEQLRLYWALIELALANQDKYATKEDLSDAVKCALGHCYRDEYTVKGQKIVRERAKSIAFGNMPQEEFGVFFDAAQKLLAETLGVTVDELDATDRSNILAAG